MPGSPKKRARKEKEPLCPIIYVLMDPVTGDVRYVGQTIRPKRREWLHCSLSNVQRSGTRVNIWLAKLLGSGQQPVLRELERTLDLDGREKFWIATLRKNGVDLLNISEGGQNPAKIGLARAAATKYAGWTPIRTMRMQYAFAANQYKRSGDLASYQRIVAKRKAIDSALRTAVRKHGKEVLDVINAKMTRRAT